MKLFFETASQADGFLLMVPVGMLAALLLDTGGGSCFRVMADVTVILLTGLAALWIVACCADSFIRLYHLLGLAAGALLYLNGIGKIIRRVRHRQDLKRSAAK